MVRRLVTSLLPEPRESVDNANPRDPSFIGIGMASSGTRWLHDQLASHRDVWVPYRKELHFFNRGIRFESARNQLNTLIHYGTTRHKLPNLIRHRTARLGLHPYDDIQIHFLCEYVFGKRAPYLAHIERTTQPQRDTRGGLSSLIENPGITNEDYEQYRRYFGYHFSSHCGEITPAYSYLAPAYIEEICKQFPQTRFILIVRDPVERQLSSWHKRERKKGQKSSEKNNSPRVITKKNNRKKDNVTIADPCQIEDRWLAAAGRERLLTLRFNEIANEPEKARDRVADFLELPNRKNGFRIEANFNRKQGNRAQGELSAEETERIREHFSDRLWDVHRRYLERFGK